MHDFVISTVAPDVLMLKRKAISMQSADICINCIGPVSYKNNTYTVNDIRK